MDDVQPEPAPAAASAKKARRQMPESTKRLLFIIGGLFVLVGSVAGFYLTSDAFDERVAVLVAARDIDAGEILAATDFGSDLVVVGAIPHVPWTLDAPAAFEGTVALQAIPAGALVGFEMVIEASTLLDGVGLEVIVPLDLSLVSGEVSEGESVLLVDRGVDPVEGDEGRQRQVVRQFRLTGLEGSQMRLLLPPEEWAEWEALLEDVGGTLMVVEPEAGADEEETMRRLDTVWAAQWAAKVDEVAESIAAAEPEAGPGELEVIVSLDAGLVPSGVVEGDRVLLIDPGAEPLGNDSGRARSVLRIPSGDDELRAIELVSRAMELVNYDGGAMQMFVGPEEWLYWRSLPDDLGGTPMVLPVPVGSDVDDMIERLNAQWHAAWEKSVAESLEPR